MINPNICKAVYCEVLLVNGRKVVKYKDSILELSLSAENVKLGNRRLYLKYSICNDRYYLCNRGY